MLKQDNCARRSGDYEEVNVKRNPYPVDFAEPRRHQGRKAVPYREGVERRRKAEDRERSVSKPAHSGGRITVDRYENRAEEPVSYKPVRRNFQEEGDFQTVAYREPAQWSAQEESGFQRASYRGPARWSTQEAVDSRTASYRGPARRGTQEAVDSRTASYREPARRGLAGGMDSHERAYAGASDRGSERGISGSNGHVRVAAVRSGQSRQAQERKRRAALRRRRRVMRQRMMVGVWVLCIFALGAAFVVRNRQVADAGNVKEDDGILAGIYNGLFAGQASGRFVQGIPEEVYAKHPEWEENFLTPNEYSRPGDALKSVKNIFVHYTANPGTSAAQNRSYFEQQKDMHEASVSSHFIIGYEGEIIQCVPLDEIAYAVMTRNYDSISIECCYKAQDGSFTQETYDSLISLLAWLTDAYGLDSEDILRHYDCGGKKCPLYYTDHEDAWEQLKKDVDKL